MAGYSIFFKKSVGKSLSGISNKDISKILDRKGFEVEETKGRTLEEMSR